MSPEERLTSSSFEKIQRGNIRMWEVLSESKKENWLSRVASSQEKASKESSPLPLNMQEKKEEKRLPLLPNRMPRDLGWYSGIKSLRRSPPNIPRFKVNLN